MTDPRDPTLELRAEAKAFPETEEGTSCNQTSFKTGGKSFLFVGPGPKGQGFKAMFKLRESMPNAHELAADAAPHRSRHHRLGDRPVYRRGASGALHLATLAPRVVRDVSAEAREAAHVLGGPLTDERRPFHEERR